MNINKVISVSALTLSLLLTGCSGQSVNPANQDDFQSKLDNITGNAFSSKKDHEEVQPVENVTTVFWPESAAFQMRKATVTNVLGGDLIEVDGVEKVRLIGITTTNETGNRERLYHQIPTEQSKSFLSNHLLNKTVYVEENPVLRMNDKGETLAYIWVGNAEELKNFNAVLLQEGLAKTQRLDPVTVYDLTFKEVENEARANGIGLWGSTK